MKKFFVFNLLIIILFSSTYNYCSDLRDAINNLNIDKVKKLLKKRGISKEEKEKMLVSIAQTIKLYNKSSKSLWSSKADLFRFLLGLSCLSVGLPPIGLGGFLLLGGTILAKNQTVREIISQAMQDPEITRELAQLRRRGVDLNETSMQALIASPLVIAGIPLTIFGLGASWLGINQTRKGWNLFTAFNRLKKARKIEDLIEKYTIKEESVKTN